jgi:antibiotic biosynthesis monooxygenase (ABM) superfamily enzyme
MRGKGPRIERETIIRFDEVSPTAEIWTASEPFYRKLLKEGYVPKADSDRSASFDVPKRSVVIRKQRSLSEKQRQVLQRHGFSSGGPRLSLETATEGGQISLGKAAANPDDA